MTVVIHTRVCDRVQFCSARNKIYNRDQKSVTRKKPKGSVLLQDARNKPTCSTPAEVRNWRCKPLRAMQANPEEDLNASRGLLHAELINTWNGPAETETVSETVVMSTRTRPRSALVRTGGSAGGRQDAFGSRSKKNKGQCRRSPGRVRERLEEEEGAGREITRTRPYSTSVGSGGTARDRQK